MSPTETKSPALDVKLIATFVNAVQHVLRTTAGWEAVVDRPRIKRSPSTDCDYSGIISFSGSIVGTVVVCYPKELAAKLVAGFVGCEIEAGSADFADAVGELTNLIVGTAKSELGANASMSVPSVIMGKGHVVAVPSDIPCLVIPCKCAAGELAVEVSIRRA